MDSLNQTPRFCYNFGDSSQNDNEFSGILEIFAHHASNIHNICIYDNQDVYAKFSLTYNPDDMVSTHVVPGGGKNPKFDEKLALNVTQLDSSVLKCEIWMHSRAKHLMEDQLLGFTLVPISQIISEGGKLNCQDFSLSSTDLFHSPAGTVQLSLTLNSTKYSSVFPLFSSVNSNLNSNLCGRNSSIASEVVLLDPNEYSRVEFPDVNADTEDHMIISGYFNSSSNHSLGSFLHLGSLLKIKEDDDIDDDDDDDKMMGNSPSNRNSGVFSSTTTSASEERNTADSSSIEKKSMLEPETGVEQSHAENVSEIESGKHTGTGFDSMGRAVLGLDESGRVNMDFEADQAAMQQQIVDMYMKSMQQFTESLAKMKLPMDFNPNPSLSPNPNSSHEDNGKLIQIMERNGNLEVENKKDSSRVFYGSRAFF
ncbi:hypothetical protein RND81_04G240100 [Saponaria officinalis]|uniref:C2 domain-containing protein n=1 Tax=Saponaria officinalis TaxID=3572 RepID=A0AAW1LH24_SAPOF